MGFLSDIFLGPDHPNSIRARYHQDDPESDFFSLFQREEKSKSINLLVGDSVVKMTLTAVKHGDVLVISCCVTEIDGRAITVEECSEKTKRLELENEAPTPVQQRTLILDTLEEFGLFGTPRQVTDDYVAGRLRAFQLEQR